jgi:hypothetical protein
MHGHWLDRHLTLPTIERLAIGAVGWLTGPPPARARPDDYEAALAPLYALAHELAQRRSGPAGGRDGAAARRVRQLLAAGRGDRPPRIAALGPALPAAVAALNAVGLGPLSADVAVDDLCPAALRAMGEVCARLGLDARYLVFGHMHRAGPRAGDDPAAWTTPRGTRLVCSGSWVAEPALERNGGYRPGTAVRVEDAGAPRVEAILGDAAPPPLLRLDTGVRPGVA